MKYEYLYNENNKLVHHSKAIRGAKYRMFPKAQLLYTYKKGDDRQFFTSIIQDSNPLFAGASGYGESAEHWNAKMKIVYEKKYFDTIFMQTIEFDKVEPEYNTGSKMPDLACYQNGDLVCFIEIYKTNKKSFKDIVKLQKLGLPIIEIDINNENKCTHIILPALLEANKQKYSELTTAIEKIEKKRREHIKQRHSELTKKYNQLKEKARTKFDQIKSKIDKGYRERQADIDRLSRGIHDFKIKIIKDKNRIKEANRAIKWTEKEIEKISKNARETESRKNDKIQKLTSEISRFKRETRDMGKAFTSLAKRCKIEWYCNKWIKEKNTLQNFKYWTS